jgi:hypothetical protein
MLVLKTFSLMYWKAHIYSVAGCLSWLDYYQESVSYVATLQCNGHSWTVFWFMQIWSRESPLVYCIQKRM